MIGMASREYDVVVVGGGHAGCEAAAAAARLGARTALVSMSLEMIAQMSCNPSIGGIAKGHLVREIDALGGVMGEVADRCGIQFRLLNRSRGPAVRAPRAQIDKRLYRREMRQLLRRIAGLELVQGEAAGILRRGERVCGLELADGRVLACRALVLTTGTFLDGLCHVGEWKFRAGRSGEKPAARLAQDLRGLGFETGRLKTGTPARLHRDGIDFGRLQAQWGDGAPTLFSLRSRAPQLPQRPCWVTSTGEAAHRIIRRNLHRSPLYGGAITGIGPRYCPSIEDKVVKFPERPAHQLFLEPEGLDTPVIYVNGLSTSLPLDVQKELVAAVAGLERAAMIRPGYAVEYDFVQPLQLSTTLETRRLEGLFHAGQINGTTGYEEAAAQGLVAGINAAARGLGGEAFVPSRAESYLGILIDDLVTRGVDEPYRMFTSRSEYRLLLRLDNADRRLMPAGRRLGLVEEGVYRRFQEKWRRQEELVRELQSRRLGREAGELEPLARRLGAEAGTPLERLLKRSDCGIGDLAPYLRSRGWDLAPEELEAVETEVKYQGYIDQQLRDVERLRGLESRRVPGDFDFRGVPGLSAEMRERLERTRPETLGQASRIPGVTAAALSLLSLHLEMRRRARP
jgi:tRNA uridine 5-carboxymethylaminomethyl modification enzyme